MCGILGSINIPLTPDSVQVLCHRGPDSNGFLIKEYQDSKCYLGHTRLAIQDLSANGNQPMESACKRYTIIFNGEIYNHWDLREKLAGVSFAGSSDTETILYYIARFGIESVADFNGIFAFTFVDTESGMAYIVRDHFGVKPVYFYQIGQGLIFASEMKVILKSGHYQKKIDESAVDHFLTLRYNPSPGTILKDIYKLKPSSYLSYDLSTKKITHHTFSYSSKCCYDPGMTLEDTADKYMQLFKAAVKRQMLSDVPVGLFLSGGVDSALLATVMKEYVPYQIKSYTVGFAGDGDFNEVKDAIDTAKLIDIQHEYAFITEEQYKANLKRSFYHVEEPIAEPTIPALFHVSQMAGKDVKVVLSGQGADEPMAGYKRYKGERLLEKYGNLVKLVPKKLASYMFRQNETITRGLSALPYNDPLERYIAICSIFNTDQKGRLYKDYENNSNIKELFAPVFETDADNDDILNKFLYTDTRTMLADDLLLFNDKVSMAFSLENRVPFLDLELIQFVESLPSHLKLHGMTSKYLVKQMAEKLLPSRIIHRKKRGFLTPVENWFKQKSFGTEFLDIVRSTGSFSNQYFSTSYIEKMLQQHQNGNANFKHHLFSIYTLETWYQEFYKTI